MSFTGNENHHIDLTTASEWTENFRNTILPGEKLGEFFGKTAIQQILNQEDCVGIRIYNSIDNLGAKHFIISGVKANEDDLFNGHLAEKGFGSPPYSGALNPLNS